MADEAPAPEPKKKGKNMVTLLGVVLGVAVLEGAGFFAAIKFFGGGPAATHGATEEHVVQDPLPKAEAGCTEVELLKRFRVPNTKSGLIVIWDFDISVSVPTARKPQMEEVVKNRAGEISDRLAQIIRQAGPRVLGEDDFATLRVLMKQALDEVVGDSQVIERVLIPRAVPMRTE
jgi:hypothetical protein